MPPGNKLPRNNPTPRQTKKVTDRQERFAIEYATDFDRVRAIRAAGYTAKTDDDAHSMACKLLKIPKVNAIVLAAKAKYAEKLGMTAEKNVQYFQVVFMEAMVDRDWTSAVAALRELGKYHGIYLEHNAQKKVYTEKDFEEAKRKLVEAGMDFTRINFPSVN